jgi:hypothetical protein
MQCLGGRPPPPELAADLALLPRLPGPAQKNLYRVLGPCLADALSSSLEAAIEDFSRDFAVDEGALTRAVRASRFLLRSAADLGKLGLGGDLADVLMPGYDAAKAMVRAEIARAALTAHGKLVEQLDWRVDQVTTSSRGEKLGLPVAVVTLGYREGDRRERITLQLLPDMLRELRAMCDRLL